MKIELKNKKVFFENNGSKKEIHPFWLRERVNGDSYVDKSTQQRLFDPTGLKESVEIDNLNLSKDFLEITFKDGAYTKLTIENILKEFSNVNEIKFINKIKWDSTFSRHTILTFITRIILLPLLILAMTITELSR